MFGRKIVTQITLFALVAVFGLTVIAVKYVHLPSLLGVSGYTVVLRMPDTGGAYTDAAVSYRGVTVGRVGAIRLTGDGVEADLQINGDAPPIPSDLVTVVANRSAIGEQYVDLRPRTDAGPYLAGGSRLAVSSADLPIPVSTLLSDTDAFVSSVPKDDLKTVVDELSDATRGSGDDLQALLDAGRSFTRAASDNYTVTSGLIDSSATVLATQQRSSGDITSFSSSLDLVARQLQSSDPDLRALIASAPGAATEVKALVDEVGVPLGVLMGNLVTTAQVFSANASGLQGVYVRMPKAVSVGHAITGADGLKVGLVTTFFDPLPCTSGYGGTAVRLPTATGEGQALNAGAGCVPTSAGSDVRGSAAALAAAAAGRVPLTGTGTGTVAPTGTTTSRGTVAVGDVSSVTSLTDLMGGAG